LAAGRIPEGFLNELARVAVGDGVDGPTALHDFNLPVMGSVVTELDVSIIGVSFRMRASDGGDRLHASVRARGHVGFPEMAGGTPEDRPSLVVRGDMLVRPLIHVDAHGIHVGLDVATAELEQMVIETESSEPEDDAVARAQAQMSEMVVGMMGDDAFEILRGEMAQVALNLGPALAQLVLGLGVEPGDGDAVVEDGALVMALRRQDGHDGTPLEALAADAERATAAIASEALAPAVLQLVEARLEGLPVPFELDLGVVGERLQGRMRNTRLMGSGLPDLRAAMAWEVHPHLRGDTIDVDLEAAWLELPEIFPFPVNRWARQLGSMVGVLPIRMTVPARAELPSSEHGEDDVSVRVESLELRAEQIDLVMALDLQETDASEG
jgi:hypothetical protein